MIRCMAIVALISLVGCGTAMAEDLPTFLAENLRQEAAAVAHIASDERADVQLTLVRMARVEAIKRWLDAADIEDLDPEDGDTAGENANTALAILRGEKRRGADSKRLADEVMAKLVPRWRAFARLRPVDAAIDVSAPADTADKVAGR